MDYSKLKKEELIEIAKKQEEDLLKKIDYDEIKKKSELFLKGSKEKDQIIFNLNEKLDEVQSKQGALINQIETQTNQKIAQVSQQQIAIAGEYEFTQKGLIHTTQTLDDIMEYHRIAHSTIEKLVARLKSVYTEEE